MRIWFETYKSNLRENTKAVYENAYNNHIREKLAALPLKSVRPVHIQGVMQDIAELFESSQDKVLNTMRQFFQAVMHNRLIAFDPVTVVKITPHSDAGKINVLSPEQQDTLMASVTDWRARVFCVLCLYAGLRR